MEYIKTSIDDVLIIKPKVFGDNRGYFFESFSEREFCNNVKEVRFVQDNESFSTRNVIRGLHYQKPPFSQGKLVRVVKGTVLDVAVLFPFSRSGISNNLFRVFTHFYPHRRLQKFINRLAVADSL